MISIGRSSLDICRYVFLRTWYAHLWADYRTLRVQPPGEQYRSRLPAKAGSLVADDEGMRLVVQGTACCLLMQCIPRYVRADRPGKSAVMPGRSCIGIFCNQPVRTRSLALPLYSWQRLAGLAGFLCWLTSKFEKGSGGRVGSRAGRTLQRRQQCYQPAA